MTKKSWSLQQIDLFSGISDQEIMKIAKQAVEKHCNCKEILYSPFDNNEDICVLKKGEITLYYSHYGKKLIIDTLKPGSIFGNFHFEENSSDHFAEVTEDAHICCFSKEDFMKIIEAKPEIMLKLLKKMSLRLSEYEKRSKNGLFDAKEKIIHYLELRDRKKRPKFLGLIKTKKLTHEQISEHIGLSRETVTRAINSLKKEGKIYNCPEKGLCLKHANTLS